MISPQSAHSLLFKILLFCPMIQIPAGSCKGLHYFLLFDERVQVPPSTKHVSSFRSFLSLDAYDLVDHLRRSLLMRPVPVDERPGRWPSDLCMERTYYKTGCLYSEGTKPWNRTVGGRNGRVVRIFDKVPSSTKTTNSAYGRMKRIFCEVKVDEK